MLHGGNYARHLAEALDHARKTSKRLGLVSQAAESRFEWMRTYGTAQGDFGAASGGLADAGSLAEAFRAAHRAHVDALSLQAILEDECFDFAEDVH